MNSAVLSSATHSLTINSRAISLGTDVLLVCIRQRDKIDVLSFGGAHSITRKYFSGRVGECSARDAHMGFLARNRRSKDRNRHLVVRFTFHCQFNLLIP